MTVKKLAPSLSISVTPKTATYRPVVHITVHLGTTKTDRTVYIYAQPAGSTRRVLLKTATVSSTGTVALTYPATHTTTFIAEFDGDSVYGAKTVTATASVGASVAMKIGGYYASQAHRLGHLPPLPPHQAADRGGLGGAEQARRMRQVRRAGVLQGQVVRQPHRLRKARHEEHRRRHFTLSNADLGYHYRIRAEYLRGSDTTNLSADSAWQYFVVEK